MTQAMVGAWQTKEDHLDPRHRLPKLLIASEIHGAQNLLDHSASVVRFGATLNNPASSARFQIKH
jgi:hypothetical protein